MRDMVRKKEKMRCEIKRKWEHATPKGAFRNWAIWRHQNVNWKYWDAHFRHQTSEIARLHWCILCFHVNGRARYWCDHANNAVMHYYYLFLFALRHNCDHKITQSRNPPSPSCLSSQWGLHSCLWWYWPDSRWCSPTSTPAWLLGIPRIDIYSRSASCRSGKRFPSCNEQSSKYTTGALSLTM